MPKDERKPDGEERVEPAEQGALDEDGGDVHRSSDAKIRFGDGVAVEAVRRGSQGDTAFLKAIEPRRGVERAVDVLLDDDERRALAR